MSSFAPQDSQDGRTHRRQLAGAANAALRGETHNTGNFSVAAGAASYALADPRMGAQKIVVLSPVNAAAATLGWWVDESTIQKGRVVIRFTAPAAAVCRFNYAIIGTKRLEA